MERQLDTVSYTIVA